jgi:DNA-binding transcriptional LysR family regulator
MANSQTLDLDLLRTLVFIAEEGSFTRAADRVGRTQSTVSLQVRRLEALVGHTVLKRSKGGAVELTPKGKLLAERARELLALNDEIMGTLKQPLIHGSVRIGAPLDYSQLYLSPVLASFARSHPNVAVEIKLGPSCELVPQLKDGKLDLILCEGGHEPRQWAAVELWRAPLRWITAEHSDAHRKDPLPLSLSPGNCPWRPAWLEECIWRGAAIRALDRVGRRHQIVSTSTTLAGLQAAVLAGLAVTVATTAGLTPGLRVVGPGEGLPELPETSVLLLKARDARQPVTDALANHLAETFGDTMLQVSKDFEELAPATRS